MMVTVLRILYGSETGTAQDVAQQLLQDAQRRHLAAELCSMDELDLSLLAAEGQICIFVCSTTGQGEEPSNMRKFWRILLRRSLQPGVLSHLTFAVLGLGDSAYERFNFAAKKLFRRLQQLGAVSLVVLGLADDQHDLGADGVVDPWCQKLWECLDAQLSSTNDHPRIPDNALLPAKVRLDWAKKEVSQNGSRDIADLTNDERRLAGLRLLANQNDRPDFEVCRLAKVACNERVTPEDHFQETRLISLELGDNTPCYAPGDVLFVQPQNLAESIEAFLELLEPAGVNCDRKFFLRSRETKSSVLPKAASFLPEPCSLRDCATILWDVQCVPRRSFFKLFACFAVDDLAKEKLEWLASAAGQQDLYDYCNRPRRSLVEVLSDFTSTFANVPTEYLFDLLPRIRPRSFSIASASPVHGSIVQLLVAVVKYKTRLARPRQGLCSTWLSRLKHGDSVHVWFGKGTIEFPPPVQSPAAPCIMIGPGTGVAPFRNFIASRACAGVGGNFLFFGCRNRHKDFYFEAEFNDYLLKGFLKLFTAFSRDQPQKIYVQHRLAENADLIWRLISIENANFYIAGSAKDMPAAVKNALLDIVKTGGNLSDEEAVTFLKDLERQKRFQTETWS